MQYHGILCSGHDGISVGKYEFKLLAKDSSIRLTRNQILSTLKFLNLNFTVARKDTILAIRGSHDGDSNSGDDSGNDFEIMAKIAATFLKEIAVTLSITRVPMVLLRTSMQKCDAIHTVVPTIVLNWAY